MKRFDDTILQAIQDPALVSVDGRVVCCNGAMGKLCPQLVPGGAVPEVLLPPEGSDGTVVLEGRTWHFACSRAGSHTLLLLRPAQGGGLTAGQLDGVARRLREQLGGLLLTIQLLSHSRECEGVPSWELRMSELNHSFCRMLRLVNHIDLLCNLEQRTPAHPLVMLDLAGLCREVCDVSVPLLEEVGVTLEYVSPLSTLLIPGDPELLQHLLMELISNAVRSAGPGGRVELDLAAGRRGKQAVITLSGSGQSQQVRPLGELLSGCASAGIPENGEGAGLGLNISQRIVTLHQGALMMERRQGSGLAVTVALPMDSSRSSLPVHTPRAEYGGGISFALVELSELLPVKLYHPLDLE